MIRILLVDDQRLFVESLKLVLTTRAEDISVVGIANNGQEALEMTNELKPDIVLMDVRMPQMDGVEAVCRIISQDPGIRVIMLTTFDDDNYVLDALNNGAAGYVLKDVPPEELITSITCLPTPRLEAVQFRERQPPPYLRPPAFMLPTSVPP